MYNYSNQVFSKNLYNSKSLEITPLEFIAELDSIKHILNIIIIFILMKFIFIF